MANFSYRQLQPEAGIQRDGTTVDSTQFIDGSWVRFYKKRAKKMGGFQLLTLGNAEIPRMLFSYDSIDSIQLFVGGQSTLQTLNVFPDLITSAPNNITPVGFVSNINNLWSMTTVANIVDDVPITYIVATACPNASDISNNTPGQVYYGNINTTDPLIALGNVTTTGGVLNLGSYLLVYGSNGYVTWNDGATITEFPINNFFQQGSSKFVAGYPVRTGNQTAGLLWSLDAVVSVVLDTTAVKFVPAYVSTITTILSPNCVVPYEPFFYWIGINTFYTYNGAVQEIQNETNKLWFFENLNQNAKEKVYGFVNKKYGEICWLFPFGDSLENNHMLIYNMNTETWYDTDQINRSCAVSSSSQFQYPIMASSQFETFNSSNTYPLWAHEKGVNRVDPLGSTALLSTFTTNKIWLIDQDPTTNVIEYDTFIPDVKLTGDMFFTISMQGYPNSPVKTSPQFTFSNATQFLTVRQKATIASFTFTSNTLDSDYLFGKTMLKIRVSDDQRMGPSSV
jgi:hypothetical protein